MKIVIKIPKKYGPADRLIRDYIINSDILEDMFIHKLSKHYIYNFDNYKRKLIAVVKIKGYIK